MNIIRFFMLFISAIAFTWSSNLKAEEELSEAQKVTFERILELDWKYEGKHKLNLSKSTLSIPEGYMSVIGDDACKYYLICQCFENDRVEAVIVSEGFEHEIYFIYCPSGYISIDDWDDIDPDLLLKSMKENTEKRNIDRQNGGRGALRTLGWIQAPVLDRNTNTVFLATEVYDEETRETIVNAKALRLGRKGFEMVTWVTDKNSYVHFGGKLDVMLRSHSFNPGYRYSDFSKGDEIASYGIASLIAATVGGKVVKAGGFLVVFKKLWGLIAAGIGALFYNLKNLFRRKNG